MAGDDTTSERASHEALFRQLAFYSSEEQESNPEEYGRVRDKLVSAHIHLVFEVVERCRTSEIPISDLQTVGCVGLIKAVMCYSWNSGMSFSDFALRLILREIRDYWQEYEYVTTHGLRRYRVRWIYLLDRLVQQADAELSWYLGRSPTLAQIAGYLGAREKEVQEIVYLRREISQMRTWLRRLGINQTEPVLPGQVNIPSRLRNEFGGADQPRRRSYRIKRVSRRRRRRNEV